MNSQSPAQHHIPLTTSIVRKAVTTVRNADASVRARIHFAEDPENAYLQDLINGTQATAVTWDIQGLTPHGLVKLHLQKLQNITQEDIRRTGFRRSLLAMDYVVVCGGESGWQAGIWPEGSGSAPARRGALIVADSDGRAQGVSIERGLQVKDVLGCLIVLQEVGNAGTETVIITEANRKHRSPALGIIGCQCMK